MKVFLCAMLFAACLCGCVKDPSFPLSGLPEVETSTITQLSTTSAKGAGTVLSSGNEIVLERGLCYGTNPNPSLSSNRIADPGGVGKFSLDMTNLQPGTLYYVRAYVTNKNGTAFGTVRNFTTPDVAVVSTSPVASISTTSAISGGTVTSSAGSSVILKGICWSMATNPTISLSTKTSNGGGLGSFSATMTGLTTRTTYYVRAYATNATGTSYGQNVSFRTN